MNVKAGKKVMEGRKPSLKSVLIEGVLEGKLKGEDVALAKTDTTVICAAIDGIGSAEDPKGSAESWASILSKVSLEGMESLGTEELVAHIRKVLISLAQQEFGQSYEKQLMEAVFSATFSVKNGRTWRHIFIWNGDGSVFFRTKKGAAFPKASTGITALPLDVLKGRNEKNAVVPNRVFNSQRQISEEADFVDLLYSKDLLFQEFKGKGTLMVYTDGLRDAFFGWYAEKGGDIHNPKQLESSYVEFMNLVIDGKFSDDELKALAHKGSDGPAWDDITYVIAEF